MSEKIFNTRIQLKYDSHANWEANRSIVLKKGEIGLDVVNIADPATSQYVPCVLAKVGDGATAWSDLRYMYAPAADVHEWAKSASKPAYSASEISGLADFIDGQLEDDNTQYQIIKVNDYSYKLQSKEADASEWSDVANGVITIPDNTDDLASLKELVGSTKVSTQISNAIDELNLSDTYETKNTASSLISELNKQDAAVAGQYVSSVSETGGVITVTRTDLPDYSNVYAAKEHTHEITNITGLQSALNGKADDSDLSDVSGKVATLIDKDADKSVRTIANEELAKQLIAEGADASMDELKEIAAWIQQHPKDASAMNTAIQKLEGILAGIGGNGEKATVVAYVADAISALKIGDYAKASDLTALASRVTTLEGSSHTHTNLNLLETYTQSETDLADAVSKKHSHANSAVLNSITTEKVAAWDAAEENVQADWNATSGDAAILNKPTLGTLAAKSAVSTTDLDAALQTTISGKADNSALAAIAKTGNVNDLVQTTGDIMVFTCGSSTEVL